MEWVLAGGLVLALIVIVARLLIGPNAGQRPPARFFVVLFLTELPGLLLAVVAGFPILGGWLLAAGVLVFVSVLVFYRLRTGRDLFRST